MLRSINELTAMAYKAARGADAPLGHVEDFAAAVAWLAVHNPENIGVIADALLMPFDPVNASGHLRIEDAQIIMAGPVMVDALRSGAAVEMTNLDVPALVSAYLGAANLAGAVGLDGSVTRVFIGDVAKETARFQGPIEITDGLWQALDVLACKTYVPSSEASRLAGAGAGLNDND